MGFRLRALNFLLRKLVKSQFARDPSIEKLRSDMERIGGWTAARTGVEFSWAPLPDAAGDGRPRLAWVGGPATQGREVADAALLYLHGGGYLFGSPATHRTVLGALARRVPARVAALDYRLAPENPFPAAFDDALAAWRALRAEGRPPERIAIAGDSAGGGLALALLAALDAEGERPAAIAAFSPWTDLALTGGSLQRNAAREAMLSVDWIAKAAERYLAGADPRDPRASPLYAAFRNPPPTLIQVGSTEALKDDSLRMADALRRAGGDVRLELLRDAPHVVHVFEPFLREASDAATSAAAFLTERLAVAASADAAAEA